MGWLDTLLEIGPFVDLFGGIVYVGLAAWVLTLRPRSPATIAFGVFTLFLGLHFVVSNYVNAGLPGWPAIIDSGVVFWSGLPMFLVVGTLVAFFPVAPRGKERRVALVASLVGLAMYLVVLAYIVIRAGWWAYPVEPLPETRWEYIAHTVQSSSSLLVSAAYWILLIGLAWRYPLLDAGSEQRWRRQIQTVTLALVLFHSLFAGVRFGMIAWAPVYASAYETDLQALGWRFLLWGGSPLVTIVTAAKWLHNAAIADDGEGRRSVGLALISLGLMLVGLLGFGWLGPDFTNIGIFGIMRIIGVFMIVYTLLRYRLFGIELKAKFAIRGSTLAGLMAGFVFIGAELLETIFNVGSTLGSVLAAAAIAAALRPLQSLARRFADRVVPATDSPEYRERHSKEILEEQYAAAARDGVITDEEAAVLRKMAERLGVEAPAPRT